MKQILIFITLFNSFILSNLQSTEFSKNDLDPIFPILPLRWENSLSLYDPDNRLSAIENYLEEKLYRKQRFFWNEEGSKKTELIAIEDGNEKILGLYLFEYDAEKMSLTQTLYGNLTGKSETEILLNQKGEILNLEALEYDTIFLDLNAIKAPPIETELSKKLPSWEESLIEGSPFKAERFNDEEGNPFLVCIYEGDACINEFHMTYENSQLLRIEQIDKLGNQISHHYLPSGLKIQFIDPQNGRGHYEFDNFGRLITEGNTLNTLSHFCHYKYDVLDHLIEENKNGEITSISYNFRGQPTRISFPDNTTEEFEYFIDGQLSKKKSRDHEWSTYTKQSESGKSHHNIAATILALKEIADESNSTELCAFSVWGGVVYLKDLGKNFLEKCQDLLNLSKEKLSTTLHLQEITNGILEKIMGKHFLQFSGYYKFHSDKGIYGGGKKLHEEVHITLINGILNTKDDIEVFLKQLSLVHGGADIHYVFRATEGWTHDILNSTLIKFGYISPQAKMLAQTWKNLIQDLGGPGGKGKIIHYAHSIGGTDTYMASTLLTAEELSMIHVITIGSPTLIPNERFASVTNYVSRRDGVCLLDPIGLVKSLFSPNHNIIFLDSFVGAPFIDHPLSGKSYQEIIKHLGERFLKEYTPIE